MPRIISIHRRVGPSCQEKIPSSCSRGVGGGDGGDPANLCDHMPAAQTCDTNGFLFLLLSWQR